MNTIPSWDEYFTRMADLAATKSKDRGTRVGAVVVGEGHTVLSTGFNGFCRGVSDSIEERYQRPLKYLFTEHAERNSCYAAARNGVSLKGATLYMNCKGYPCADCARAIIQSGIAEVVSRQGSFEGKGDWAASCAVAKEMLEEAGVKVVHLDENFRRV